MALGIGRFSVPAFLILAATVAVLALGQTAHAATDCRQQVIADWSADGSVDRIYPLEDVIEALAPDIRDYTDAQESIERAQMLALRAKGRRAQAKTKAPARSLAAAQQVEPGGSPPIPIPLLVLGALGGTALLAGGFALVGHRARKR